VRDASTLAVSSSNPVARHPSKLRPSAKQEAIRAASEVGVVICRHPGRLLTLPREVSFRPTPNGLLAWRPRRSERVRASRGARPRKSRFSTDQGSDSSFTRARGCLPPRGVERVGSVASETSERGHYGEAASMGTTPAHEPSSPY
jgi:hypothetical protein